MIMEHVKWKKKREIRTATSKWKQSVTLLTFFQILLLRTMVMVIRNNSFSILTPSHIHISKIWAYMLMPMMWKYKNDVSALLFTLSGSIPKPSSLDIPSRYDY